MKLPTKCKANKPSKYAPVYDIPPTWEQLYWRWVWPYRVRSEVVKHLIPPVGEIT